LEAERLNTRHVALNRAPVPVMELVEQIVADYFERDRQRICIEFENPAIVANVDDARLILLIKNLLSNALRYSESSAGPVTLHAALERDELVLEIKDRGPGFSPQHCEHIGQPFFRGDPSRTRQTGGTGLGLYISRLIAEAHGGSLKLDRGYSEGACLVVRLPA
jgi:signal transduction histidine kinase